MGFGVDDVDLFHASATAAGVRCVQPPKMQDFGAKMAVYADPDGLPVSIVGAVEPPRWVWDATHFQRMLHSWSATRLQWLFGGEGFPLEFANVPETEWHMFPGGNAGFRPLFHQDPDSRSDLWSA